MMTEGKMDGTTETLTRFWRHALEKNMTLGDAFRAAKEDMTTHARKTDGYHFVQCELNLLGDPTLDVRASAVNPINASATLTISGNGETTVTVEGADGCSVCVWDKAGWYQTAKSNSNEKIILQTNRNITGPIHVTAYAPNRNVWVSELIPD